MKYSFVLPAYKATFLKEAIDSIIAQTYTDYELIIVNDASPQDLDSIVKNYDDPRIRYYVNEQNIGGTDLVAQWNHCITYAKGEYIILASDDDVYHQDYLEEMNILVDKYPAINVFRPRIQMIDNKGNITHIAGILNEYTTQLEFLYNIYFIRSGIPYYIFNRKALEKIGGFVNYPLAWHSDDMTVARLAENGIAFCPDILFSFRNSGENISSKQNDTASLRSKINATLAYYSDLKQILINTTPKNNKDNFYIKKLYNTIPQTVVSTLRDWFFCSSKIAALNNFPFLYKTKCFSTKSLIKMYIRRLLK